jgi:hypothetical protein
VVEALEHPVERVGEILDLVPRAVQGDALVQATVGRRSVGNPSGGLGHPVQRLKQATGDQPAQGDRGRADHGQRNAALGEQRVEGIVPGLVPDLIDHEPARRR